MILFKASASISRESSQAFQLQKVELFTFSSFFCFTLVSVLLLLLLLLLFCSCCCLLLLSCCCLSSFAAVAPGDLVLLLLLTVVLPMVSLDWPVLKLVTILVQLRPVSVSSVSAS